MKNLGLVLGMVLAGQAAMASADAAKVDVPALQLECTHAAQYGVELKPFKVDLGMDPAYLYVGRVTANDRDELVGLSLDADLHLSYSESECEDSTDMFFVESELKDLASGKTKSVDMILKHSSPEIELKGALLTCRKI